MNQVDPSGLIMSAITSSGLCPVGAGESRVNVPCVLLQIYDKNNPNEALAAEWDNLPEECQKGLKAKYGNASINSMLKNLNRVVAVMDTIEKAANAKGIDPALLAAIALKENNGENGLQRCAVGVTWGDPKCMGAGMFQIDLGKHPDVSKDQALDVSFAAQRAANILKTNMTTLASKFPNFTGDELLQATAASYNFGTRNISGNPATIDERTKGVPINGYGFNVMQLMECFR